MAIVVTNNMHYINISNAIRAAMGVNNQYKPAEMAAAINSIVDFYIQSVINNSVISNQIFEKVTSGSLIQTNNQYYGDIANSIRVILGTGNLYKPSEMSTAISEIINMLSSTSIIAVTAPSGSTVTCTNGSIVKIPIVKNGKWYFWGCGNGEWIVNATLNNMNAYSNININEPGVYNTTLSYVKIYGISRDITSSSPEWTRTDDAIGLTAKASRGTTAGFSDFDSRYPWSGIQRETLSTGDVMVKIPKFYFRRYRKGNIEHIEIADGPLDGFIIHPLFNHANQKCDYVYVGAYETSEDNMSVSGGFPFTWEERSICRGKAKEKGDGWGLIDIATISAIQMLILVEFANNDVKSVIGAGYNLPSTRLKSGSCDAVQNLTGAPTGPGNVEKWTGVVYRGIENFWGNVEEWVDGINFQNGKYFVCNNPALYSDGIKNGYTELSFISNASSYNSQGYIIEVGLDNGENSHIILPETIDNDKEEYYYYSYFKINGEFNGWKSATHGGVYMSDFSIGLFSIDMCDSSYDTRYTGYRLLYIPTVS